MAKTRRFGTFVLLRLLMGVCLLGVLISVYILFVSQREYARGDAAYAQVRTLMEERQETEFGSESDLEIPVVKEAKQVDFNALRQINEDAVAWITEEEGVIDYPVVQGKDNDYYLKHLFTGQKNKLGSLFVDYRTPGDFSGKSTVLYGHNMKDGSMFASLTNYKDQAYYDERSVMQLYTPEGSYSIEFFAGIVADGDYEFLRLDFNDDRDFLAYIGDLKAESTFQSEVEVKAEDRIVALCTCSYEFNNARYALIGKLIPVG